MGPTIAIAVSNALPMLLVPDVHSLQLCFVRAIGWPSEATQMFTVCWACGACGGREEIDSSLGHKGEVIDQAPAVRIQGLGRLAAVAEELQVSHREHEIVGARVAQASRRKGLLGLACLDIVR